MQEFTCTDMHSHIAQEESPVQAFVSALQKSSLTVPEQLASGNVKLSYSCYQSVATLN